MLEDAQRSRNSKHICHSIRGRVRFSPLLDAGNGNDNGSLRELTQRMVPDLATINIDGGMGVHFSSNEFTFDKSEPWSNTNTPSWTFPRHRRQAYSVRNIEETVSVAHHICMVCFLADIKVSMDNPPHETLRFKKPHKF